MQNVVKDGANPGGGVGDGDGRTAAWEGVSRRGVQLDHFTGTCSTVPYFILSCVLMCYIWWIIRKCTISSQFEFQASLLRCSKLVTVGKSSFETHLHFDLLIVMPKRFKMGNCWSHSSTTPPTPSSPRTSGGGGATCRTGGRRHLRRRRCRGRRSRRRCWPGARSRRRRPPGPERCGDRLWCNYGLTLRPYLIGMQYSSNKRDVDLILMLERGLLVVRWHLG